MIWILKALKNIRLDPKIHRVLKTARRRYFISRKQSYQTAVNLRSLKDMELVDFVCECFTLSQTLLPEAPKRSQMIQQSPFYLTSFGWQTGYKRNPYMVYPHLSTGLSINDPRRTNQGLSIFDPRGKKATQRYLRYL